MDQFPNILCLPSRITLETDGGTFSASGADTLTFGDVRIEYRDDAVYLTAGATPVRAVRLRWDAPLPGNARFCADHWERGYGDLEWRGFVPHRVMPWYFLATADGATALYGVKVRPDALCAFLCDPAGITLHLDVACGADGAVLNGRTICCAELVCEETQGRSAFEAACALTRRMSRDPVFPPAPVYGYNNWYYAYGNGSAEETLRSAAELAALTKGLKNRPYLVIDDCWQKERPTGFIGGDWRASNEKFPDMAALAREIAAQDVLPGIWMRPLQNKAAYIPRRLYRNREAFLLDPSIPETLESIAEDVRTITGWGYRLIKHDYSTCDIIDAWGNQRGIPLARPGVHFANRDKTTAMLIKELYRAIYDAANGKALILGCNTVGHLGVGYMELSRTGDDTSGREWSRTLKMGVNTLAFRLPHHNAFYAADADCVGITNDVPWEKNRQWMELLALSGTPLFISVSPQSLTPEQYEEIRRAFAAASENRAVAEPLDWMNDCCPSYWRINGETRAFSWY